jgi:hypothetical protein
MLGKLRRQAEKVTNDRNFVLNINLRHCLSKAPALWISGTETGT